MELKRVLSGKTYLWLVLALGFVITYYVYETRPGTNADLYKEYNMLLDEYDFDFSSIQTEYSEMLTIENIYAGGILENTTFSEKISERYLKLYEADPSFADREEWKLRIKALSMINNDFEKAENYNAEIEGIMKNAEKLRKNKALVSNGSFILKNAEKTVTDFAKLQDLKINPIKYAAVKTVLEMKILPISVLVLCFLLPLSFFEERKKGLNMIINQASGGRGKLAVKRCLIIVFCSLVFSAALYLAAFMVAFLRFGGTEIIFEPIQAVDGFRHCIKRVNVLEMAIIQSFYSGIASAFIVLLLWLLILVFADSFFGAAVFLIIMGTSFWVYNSFSDQSSLMALKYINPVAFLDTYHIIADYKNVIFAGCCINLFDFELFILLLLFLVFSFLYVALTEHLKPAEGKKSESVVLVKIIRIREKLFEKTGLFVCELYQLMFIKKGILILLTGIILVYNTGLWSGVPRSRLNIALDGFYDKYSGNYEGINKREVEEYVSGLETAIEEAEAEYRHTKAKYASGKTDFYEFMRICGKYDNMKLKQEMLSHIKDHINRLETAVSQNKSVYLADDRPFDLLFSKKTEKNLQQVSVIVCIGMILFVSLMYEEENKSRVMDIVNAASGRKKHLSNKRAVLAFSVFVYSVIIYSINIKSTVGVCGINNISIKAWNVRQFADFDLGIPILFILGLLILYKCFLATAFSLLLLNFTKKIRMIPAALLLILLLMPHLLTTVGFSAFYKFDIIRLFTAFERQIII